MQHTGLAPAGKPPNVGLRSGRSGGRASVERTNPRFTGTSRFQPRTGSFPDHGPLRFQIGASVQCLRGCRFAPVASPVVPPLPPVAALSSRRPCVRCAGPPKVPAATPPCPPRPAVRPGPRQVRCPLRSPFPRPRMRPHCRRACLAAAPAQPTGSSRPSVPSRLARASDAVSRSSPSLIHRVTERSPGRCAGAAAGLMAAARVS